MDGNGGDQESIREVAADWNDAIEEEDVEEEDEEEQQQQQYVAEEDELQHQADEETKKRTFQNGRTAKDAAMVDREGKGPRDAFAEEKTSSTGGKIFIGGLSWDTSTDHLTSHFKKYGEITDAVIMKDRSTGHPRGFGFVTFSDASACEHVVQDKHVIGGRMVEAKISVPRENMGASKGPKTKKIFVGGIPALITDEEFRSYFAGFGNVLEHQIMQDHSTGRSRGFGFVTYDSEQPVDDILTHGKMHELGGKQVEIKKAEPKRPLQANPGYEPGARGGDGDGYNAAGGGAYGGYSEGAAYGGMGGGGGYGSYGGSYRSGGGGYGVRAGGYGGGGYGGGYGGAGMYGRGGYGGGGGASGVGVYGIGAMGGGGYGGGYGSAGGYSSSMMGGYGDRSDVYGGMAGYGGYSGGGYGGGGYGASYGSSRGYGSSSNGRYHPYSRN